MSDCDIYNSNFKPPLSNPRQLVDETPRQVNRSRAKKQNSIRLYSTININPVFPCLISITYSSIHLFFPPVSSLQDTTTYLIPSRNSKRGHPQFATSMSHPLRLRQARQAHQRTRFSPAVSELAPSPPPPTPRGFSVPLAVAVIGFFLNLPITIERGLC